MRAEPVIFEALVAIGTNVARSPEIGRFLTVLLAESLTPDHPANAWFKLAEAETSALLVRLTAHLVPAPEAKARQLIAAMHGLQLHWFRADCSFDLVAEWEAMIAALLPLRA